MTARWRVTVAFSFDRVIFRDVVVEGANVTEAKRATRTLFTWGTSHRIERMTLPWARANLMTAWG